MLVPVILAGGSGTRLWPLSREAYPKQFISLFQQQSLFQLTLERLKHLDCANPIVVGNEQHRFLMAEQMRQSYFSECAIILEPSFKGTAPAVALAAIQALTQFNKEVVLLVLPSDHLIEDNQGFAKTVKEGFSAALDGKLVTFGIPVSRPETGYGYIQQGDTLSSQKGFKVKRFIEKPDLLTAKQFLESREYWWNSGMFLFSANSFLQELSLHESLMLHEVKKAMQEAKQDIDFIRPDALGFEKITYNSIDYAVMEKTIHGALIPLQSKWHDVGAWDALTQFFPKDEHGNASQGDVLVKESHDCLVHANHRLVVIQGVQDLIIVETQDAVLVLNKAHAQEIKAIVTEMKNNTRKEVLFHQKVLRPWGYFESIDAGDRFQVKRITVDIGQKLSLQRHHHRCEHWVVVKGTARVTRGEEVFLLAENQSTYIPIGVNHRLENVGKIPLEMIEVQSGAYLGEDDITRLEDQYGRLVPLNG